jgi:hypothetical protein
VSARPLATAPSRGRTRRSHSLHREMEGRSRRSPTPGPPPLYHLRIERPKARGSPHPLHPSGWSSVRPAEPRHALPVLPPQAGGAHPRFFGAAGKSIPAQRFARQTRKLGGGRCLSREPRRERANGAGIRSSLSGWAARGAFARCVRRGAMRIGRLPVSIGHGSAPSGPGSVTRRRELRSGCCGSGKRSAYVGEPGGVGGASFGGREAFPAWRRGHPRGR